MPPGQRPDTAAPDPSLDLEDVEPSALLSAIVDCCEDAIISKDLNGVIRSWNRAAERLFGYTAKEVIGRSIAILIPSDRLDEEPRILEQIRNGTKIEHFETVRMRKDGSFLNISLTVSPVKDSAGRIVGASKVARDVTDKVRMLELQQRLAAIVESSDDAIISKDLQGVIQSWNRGAERIFGYTAEEIVGQHISKIAAPERVDEIPGILEKIRRGERVEHFETKRKTKAGKILSVSLTVSPIRNSAGKVIGASKVARDITERVLHEHALEDTNAALRRANQDLLQFSYSASHDLQEPLRMIAAFGELLRRKFGSQLESTGQGYIQRIVDGAARMDALLRDLRTYTQISAEEQEPTEDIAANEILDATLRNLETSIQESAATVSSGDLPKVRIYRFELQQLLQNLIGNAIRYRSDQSPRVHVAAVQRRQEWLFSVSDNGIGIAPEFKEQIFGVFKRLHSAADYPGTGMGLAICERIVERAGGRIWVESAAGQGSTFFFTIPYDRPARNPGRG